MIPISGHLMVPALSAFKNAFAFNLIFVGNKAVVESDWDCITEVDR